MEQQLEMNDQKRSLFRGHPKMNAEPPFTLNGTTYRIDNSRNQVPAPMILGQTLMQLFYG